MLLVLASSVGHVGKLRGPGQPCQVAAWLFDALALAGLGKGPACMPYAFQCPVLDGRSLRQDPC